MKHLLLEIVEATEAAALAASKYIGSGDKLQIDKVATEAMRTRLNQIPMNAKVVIGEGIKDGSFGLYEGERVGSLWLRDDLIQQAEEVAGCKAYHEYEIAVDPVDGTTQTAKGGYEAVSVIAVGSHGCLMDTEVFYMNKLAVGKDVAKEFYAANGLASFNLLHQPIPVLIANLQRVLDKKQVTVCVLDRPRHTELVKELRACNCCIKFIQDCDVSGAIAAALPESGIDLFLGIGGAPEGVISAAAMKCLGGYFEGQLVDNKTYQPIDNKVYAQEDLAKGDVMFAATGITSGSLLKGVRMEGKGSITHSILMESSTKSFKRVKSYYE